MKKLTLILFVLLPWMSYAQKMDNSKVILPTKDGSIFFEKVIELPQADKESIFNASLKWLATTFVDANEVVQLKDKDAGSIVGKGNFSFVQKGFLADGRTLWFMVDISCKESKSRIRLYKFQDRTTDGNYYPFENQYNSYMKEMEFPKSGKKLYVAFKDRVDGIIEEYQLYMKSNAVKDDF